MGEGGAMAGLPGGWFRVCGWRLAGWPVAGFLPRAVAGVPTFSGCFRPIVGGFPANAQTGKLQEEASKRRSGNQAITAVAALLIGCPLAGVRSRTVRNQGILNASLSEPQLTLKTMAETKPEETPDRTPGLR